MAVFRRLSAVLAVILAFAGPGPGPGAGDAWAAANPPLPLENLFGGPFELVNQDGQAVTDRDFRGRYMLIYFGYSYCPDICPYSLQTMAEALELVGAPDAAKVQPLFITTDPARDTPAFLKDYVALYGDRLIGLTGSEAQIRQAAKAYRIHRRKITPADPEPGNDYLVSHSSLVYLMDPDGKFLTFFPYDTDAETMADAISRYVMAAGTAGGS